jgi:mono/diheme cytochrome c family protein
VSRVALAVAALALGVVRAAAIDRPQLDYVVHCQGCHRADGSGTPGTIPPLAGSVGKLLRATGGREFLVRVPGVAMAPLDDAEVAAVLNWMLVTFGGADVPRDFAPYSTREIARLRVDPLVDVDAVRAVLVGGGSQADSSLPRAGGWTADGSAR